MMWSVERTVERANRERGKGEGSDYFEPYEQNIDELIEKLLDAINNFDWISALVISTDLRTTVEKILLVEFCEPNSVQRHFYNLRRLIMAGYSNHFKNEIVKEELAKLVDALSRYGLFVGRINGKDMKSSVQQLDALLRHLSNMIIALRTASASEIVAPLKRINRHLDVIERIINSMKLSRIELKELARYAIYDIAQFRSRVLTATPDKIGQVQDAFATMYETVRCLIDGVTNEENLDAIVRSFEEARGIKITRSAVAGEEVEAEVAEFRATGEREVAGGAEFDWIDEDWENILQHPRVFAVIGHRESGKSALAHAILEYYVKKYNLKAYLVNTSGRPIPRKKLEALPKFITVVNSPDEIPVNAVVLYDEAYGRLHARTTHTSEAIMTDKLIELSRHKGWTLIYVTQESRKIDVNVLSGLDALFIKRPTDLRVSHERKEIRDVISEALRLFRKIRGNFREYVFVWSVNPDFEFKGMKRCGLPSYWNDELSKFYAGW